MKRPMIFISGLSEPQLEHLKSLTEYGSLKNFSKCTQVYTYTDGSLGVAYASTVDKIEEIQCKTYDEFLTRWNEYKLWLLLQTQ